MGLSWCLRRRISKTARSKVDKASNRMVSVASSMPPASNDRPSCRALSLGWLRRLGPFQRRITQSSISEIAAGRKQSGNQYFEVWWPSSCFQRVANLPPEARLRCNLRAVQETGNQDIRTMPAFIKRRLKCPYRCLYY